MDTWTLSSSLWPPRLVPLLFPLSASGSLKKKKKTLLRCNLQAIKFTHVKDTYSVILSEFAELCRHHLHLGVGSSIATCLPLILAHF